MATPKFRDLTLDELGGRGWRVQDGSPVRRQNGTWDCILVLLDGAGILVHAATGQGQTGDEAREKAVEIANRWRRVQAEKRSREEGQTNQ